MRNLFLKRNAKLDVDGSSWLAQKPVRQLTLTGVGAVAFTLLVATTLSLWHGKLSAEATRVGNNLHVAQLAAGQGTIAINEAWANSLQFGSGQQHSSAVDLGGWAKELELAASLCEQLNQERLIAEYGGHLQISIAPLKRLSEDARQWQRKAAELQSEIDIQRKRFDAIAEQMMRRAEGIRGTERLSLAVALRQQGQGGGQLNIKQLMNGSATTAAIYQLMNDLTDLQLNLHRLLSTKNADEIVDLAKNKIETQLLRITAVDGDEEINDLAMRLQDVAFLKFNLVISHRQVVCVNFSCVWRSLRKSVHRLWLERRVRCGIWATKEQSCLALDASCKRAMMRDYQGLLGLLGRLSFFAECLPLAHFYGLVEEFLGTLLARLKQSTHQKMRWQMSNCF